MINRLHIREQWGAGMLEYWRIEGDSNIGSVLLKSLPHYSLTPLLYYSDTPVCLNSFANERLYLKN
jgi:hypothetical protein